MTLWCHRFCLCTEDVFCVRAPICHPQTYTSLRMSLSHPFSPVALTSTAVVLSPCTKDNLNIAWLKIPTVLPHIQPSVEDSTNHHAGSVIFYHFLFINQGHNDVKKKRGRGQLGFFPRFISKKPKKCDHFVFRFPRWSVQIWHMSSEGMFWLNFSSSSQFRLSGSSSDKPLNTTPVLCLFLPQWTLRALMWNG